MSSLEPVNFCLLWMWSLCMLIIPPTFHATTSGKDRWEVCGQSWKSCPRHRRKIHQFTLVHESRKSPINWRQGIYWKGLFMLQNEVLQKPQRASQPSTDSYHMAQSLQGWDVATTTESRGAHKVEFSCLLPITLRYSRKDVALHWEQTGESLPKTQYMLKPKGNRWFSIT